MSRQSKVTRAERVRERRKKDSRRHLAHGPTRLPTAPFLTPRGVTLEASMRRSPPTKHSMRRYQAAVALDDRASWRAADLPQVRFFGWRMLSFLLLAVLMGAAYWAWTHPQFHVVQITLVGARMVSAEEVQTVLRLQGMSIFLVQPAQAVNALRAHFPEFQAASVSVAWPNRVIVSVHERAPVIRWEQDGAYAWIDAQGVIFRPRGEVDGLIVVRASGRPPAGPRSNQDPWSPTPFLASHLVEAVRLLAPHVPADFTLLYDPKYGLGWADRRGWTVWFGERPDQIEMQLRVYAALVDSILQRGILPSLINMTHPSAPYYRIGQ